jgi:hypothetical protein
VLPFTVGIANIILLPLVVVVIPEKSLPTSRLNELATAGSPGSTPLPDKYNFAYIPLARDFNSPIATCAAEILDWSIISRYLEMATAAKIPKITSTVMISINVKPFSFFNIFSSLWLKNASSLIKTLVKK